MLFNIYLFLCFFLIYESLSFPRYLLFATIVLPSLLVSYSQYPMNEIIKPKKGYFYFKCLVIFFNLVQKNLPDHQANIWPLLKARKKN